MLLERNEPLPGEPADDDLWPTNDTEPVEATPDRARHDRAVDGAAFVADESAEIAAVWGSGQQVLWAEGEGLMVVGPDGVGKTSLVQQLVRARLGLADELLGFPVAPTARKVLMIAADRPRQSARSFRRMTSDEDLEILRDRLVVWRGPLPFDVTAEPSRLAEFTKGYGADTLVTDSLKDVALDLSKDEIGGRVNLACQEVIAEGIELGVIHHQRKETSGGGKPKHLADVYGSRWLTAGMGSVILLWGEAGDLVVELNHLKQPAEEVGPLDLVHDHRTGTTIVRERPTVESLLAQASFGLTVSDTARLYFGTEGKPTANQIEKVRRRLEALIEKGDAERRDDPDGLARYFTRNLVA